jgi:hypothetical protein
VVRIPFVRRLWSLVILGGGSKPLSSSRKGDSVLNPFSGAWRPRCEWLLIEVAHFDAVEFPIYGEVGNHKKSQRIYISKGSWSNSIPF